MVNLESARAAVRECLSKDSNGLTGYTEIFRSAKFNSYAHARYVLGVVSYLNQENLQTEKVGTLSVRVANSIISPSDLVDMAHSDAAAWDACITFMPFWGRSSAELLAFNDQFVSGAIKRPGGKGRSIKSNNLRDFRIALAVFTANKQGLPIYGDKSNSLTACDLVADESGLDTETVKRIWKSIPKDFKG